MAFLRHLRAHSPEPLIVIRDNGPAHSGEPIREHLATPDLRLRPVRLPASSADFNADEHVWGWIRESVTANTCFGTAAVWAHVDPFLAGLAARPEEVRQRGRTVLRTQANTLDAVRAATAILHEVRKSAHRDGDPTVASVEERAVTPMTPAPIRPRAAGRDWLTIVLVELAGLLALAFVWVLWQVVAPIAHTVVLFLLGAALAFVLADPADRLARRLGGKRPLAILLTYLLVAVVVLGGLLLLAAPLAREATRLTGDLPAYRTGIQRRVQDLDLALRDRGVHLDLDSLRAQAMSAVEGRADAAVSDLLRTAATLGGALMDAVLVLVISVYLLAGAPVLQRNAAQVVPRRYRAVHEFVRSSAARVMGGYLRGQLTVSVVIGVLAGAGTALLGLPYFVVLGVLARLFELVLMFGPILSAVPAVVVALFQPWPTVLWVVLLFLVIQQFESNVLGPRVTGHAVGLHPLGALFALLVGIEVAGILGGLFAVPVAGVLWVLTAAAYRQLVASEPVAQVADAVRREPAAGPTPATGSAPGGPARPG